LNEGEEKGGWSILFRSLNLQRKRLELRERKKKEEKRVRPPNLTSLLWRRGEKGA